MARFPMTLTASPPAVVSDEEPEALFKEARRRRRLRWITGLVLTLVAASVTASLLLSGGPRTGGSRTQHLRHPALRSGPPQVATTPTVPLDRPQALAVAPDGNVLVSNQGSNQVLQLLPNGRLVAFAGDGRSGSGGDGGRATAAQLDSPQGLAVGSHGITYVADTGNNRIQAISPAGVMSTLAEVSDPTAIAIGPDNILYTLDSSGLQTVGANGAVATLIPTTSARNGTPVNLLTIDGSSFAFFPSAIAVTSSGTLYLANSSPKELIEDSGGTFSLIGSSSVAEGVPYVTPNGLVASDNGDVFVANYGTFGVDRVVGASLTPVFAFGLHSVPGLEGFRPSGVAVGARGVLYVDTDGVNGGSNRAALVAIEPGDQVHLLAAGPITS